MKLLTIIFCLILVFALSNESLSQFDLGKKLKKKVEKRIERGVDKTIDKGLDETENAIENGGNEDQTKEVGKKEIMENEEEVKQTPDNSGTNISTSDEELNQKLVLWSKYDFVAGDKIIFQDDLVGEENGEFPSRWDLAGGSAEIANLGSEKVIFFTSDKAVILPLMDKKNFLPDVFTIEFDVYFDEMATRRSNHYLVRFYEGTGAAAKIDGERRYPLDIRWDQVKMDKFGSKTASFNEERKNWNGKWKHVSISFNQRSLKVYLDEERMINIPNLGYKPEMFSLGCNYDARYIKVSAIKNIRVNEGGKKLYDRVISDGKFVTTGILFDVNKSTIKSESMGTINEIVNMMKDHSDLKFIIEGHTDSDGENGFNQKLSEDRATAVKNILVESGIDASRLKSKGWGESKPLDSNSTPEGKANNRRVEFIKL